MWIEMIRSYLSQRVQAFRLLALAVLMSLFVVEFVGGWTGFLEVVLFWWISLVVFRFFDDAGSWYVDRVGQPDRKYLSGRRLKYFFLTTFLLLISYHLYLIRWSVATVQPLLVYTVSALVLYLSFYRQNVLIQAIALSKYAVILYALGTMDWRVCLSGTLIMVCHDILEERKYFVLGLLLSTFAGVLLFSRVPVDMSWSFILLPSLILLLLRKTSYVQYVPLILFPILYALSR